MATDAKRAHADHQDEWGRGPPNTLAAAATGCPQCRRSPFGAVARCLGKPCLHIWARVDRTFGRPGPDRG